MASFSTWGEQIDTGARLLVPYALMAVLFLLNVTAMSYPFTSLIKAPLFLAGIYYWSIYRPTLIPAWLAFITGCLIDILSGLPIGLNALVFVATHWLVADQRRFLMAQSFMMIWIIFALVVITAGLLQWGLFGLVHLHWSSLQPLVASTLLGVMIFPLISVVLHLSHKILPAPRQTIRFNSQT